MSVILPRSLYPYGSNVILVSDPDDPLKQYVVKALLSSDQIWAHNLLNRLSLFAVGSMIVVMISMVGMSLTQQPVYEKTKNYGHRFFIGLSFAGGLGFLGTFAVGAYAAYHYNKM